MDAENQMMDARAAKMAELIEAKIIVRNSGTETNGMIQAQRALARWQQLGGTGATFEKINAAHFAGMTEAAQSLLVKTIEAANG